MVRNVDRLSARFVAANRLVRPTHSRGSYKAAKGFSLLEILVAFTLLAMVMGVLMQIFSRGVNGATLADRYAKATMYAESMLAGVGVEEGLKESSSSGKFDDDYTWALSIRPYQDPFPKEQSVVEFERLMPTQLFEVDLKVSFTPDDRRERVFNLSTLKLGPKS